MLRQVRYKSVLQDADRLRNPAGYDRYESLARALSMGSPRAAREALVAWLRDQIDALGSDPLTRADDWACVKAIYTEMRAKADGRDAVLNTELGYFSQNVGPDFGSTTLTFAEWASPSNLRRLLHEGHELVMNGHVGAGKSHSFVLLMELALLTMKNVVVATNIPGIEARTHRRLQVLREANGRQELAEATEALPDDLQAVNRFLAERVHPISKLSDVLRLYTQLPVGTTMFLVIDEPEAILRGGPRSKSRDNWNNFRYVMRKLRMVKGEIWHTRGEVYKELREEVSDQVVFIDKDHKSSMDVTAFRDGKPRAFRVEDIPDLKHLAYSHRATATIFVDVDFTWLMRYLANVLDEATMKEAVAEALEDASLYLADWVPPHLQQEDSKEEKAGVESAVLEQVLANPDAYRGARGGWDANRIASDFGLTHRDAQTVARRARNSWQG